MNKYPNLARLCAGQADEKLSDHSFQATLLDEARKLDKYLVLQFHPKSVRNRKIIEMISKLAERLATDPVFDENLKKHNLMPKMFGRLIEHLLFRISEPKFMRNHFSAVMMMAQSLMKHFSNRQCFLEDCYYDIWLKLFYTFRKSNFFTSQYLVIERGQLEVPGHRWKNLKEGDEISLIEIGDSEFNFKKRARVCTVDWKSKLVKVSIDGDITDVSMSRIMPQSTDTEGYRRVKLTDRAPGASVFFYDHQHGWLEGRVISSCNESIERQGIREMITIAVDFCSATFLTMKKTKRRAP